jgi:hypothetical protein
MHARNLAVLLAILTGWAFAENLAAIGTLSFAKHHVDSAFGRFHSIHAADVDGDGDTDILGASTGDDKILWWENLAGDGSVWSEHIVDDFFWVAISVQGADVDGDGDVDILGAAYLDDDITWWENVTGDGSAWSEHTLNGDFNGVNCVRAADMDGDGDLDVLGSAQDVDRIAWWENLAGNGTGWAEHTVDGNIETVRSVHPADMDGDGDLDIVGVAFSIHQVAWWKNTSGNGLSWSKHLVDDFFQIANFVHAADIDGDADMDIVAVAERDDDVAWWENLDGEGSAWDKHPVDNFFDQANSVHAADVDGDGDVDILATALQANDITLWENTAGDGSAWNEITLDSGFDGISVYAADMDGDGDMDVIGAEFDPGEVAWWENEESGGFSLNAGLNDAWYNPATDGQGFFITVFPDSQQLFLAWFTYDTERPPANVEAILGEPGHRWLTAFGPYQDGLATLEIELTSGGEFNAIEPMVTQESDGEILLEFSDCENAFLSYDIASVNLQGEIPIERIAPDNVSRCEELSVH